MSEEPGEGHALLMQVDGAGAVHWVRTWDRGGCDDAYTVEVDGAGDVLVAGGTFDSTSCDSGGERGFLAKWDASGNLLWSRLFSPSPPEVGELGLGGLAVEPSTHAIYVSGSVTAGSRMDAWIAKLSPSGTLLWTRTWGGPGDDLLLVTFSDGGLYGTGATTSCVGVLRSCHTISTTSPAASVGAPAGATFQLPGTLSSMPLGTVEQAGTSCADLDSVLVELERTDTGSPYCFGDGSGTVCPCGNAGCSKEGCSNSTGRGAELQASGTESVLAADLRLHGAGARPGQPGLFFQGSQATNGGAGLHFGGGLRCAGSNVNRLQVVIPDAAGDATTTVDIATRGGVQAGDLRRYQYWYRDPGGSCGSGFNLSNGVEIQWTP